MAENLKVSYHILFDGKDAGKIVLSGNYAETDVKNAVDGKEVN